jgi:small redox-active disulfide protein 2
MTDEKNISNGVNIKILGMGCAKCRKLEENAKKAVKDLGIEVEILKVDEIQNIMPYGAMNLPALVIDEKVVVSGRVPDASEIKKLIEQNK